MNFIQLKGGPTVAEPALLLALKLEEKGFSMSVNGGKLAVVPGSKLPVEAKAQISKWQYHLMAITAYRPPEAP